MYACLWGTHCMCVCVCRCVYKYIQGVCSVHVHAGVYPGRRPGVCPGMCVDVHISWLEDNLGYGSSFSLEIVSVTGFKFANRFVWLADWGGPGIILFLPPQCCVYTMCHQAWIFFLHGFGDLISVPCACKVSTLLF